MQIYDITVQPNNVQEVASQGRYIYYYNGSAGGADASITVKHDMSGTAIILRPGQAFRLDDKERGGGRWLIGNYANTAPILGRIVVGNGRIEDNTITGSVQVIDGGKYRTLAGSAFSAAQNIGPVAGQLSTAQIWNPVGSGVNCFIEKYSFSSATAEVVRVGWNTQENSASRIPTSAKKAGGSVANAVGNPSTLVAVPVGFQYMQIFNVGASLPLVSELREPICLPPGFGFCVQGVTLNTDLNINVEFFEESI